MKFGVRLAVLSLSAFVVSTASSIAMAARDFGPHRGYLETTRGEREKKVEELILFQPPPPLGPTFQEKIFNETLSKEFRDKYEEKFGRTEIERIYYAPNRASYYNDVYGLRGTPEEINNERREFADFMVRRLTEYHVDDYLKNDPDARPIYEAKERISNIQVKVQQFRFDMKYSISGNTFDLKVINPYLELAQVRLQMDPGAFGPAPIKETRIQLQKAITKKVGLASEYRIEPGLVSLIASRNLMKDVTGTLSASTFTRDTDEPNEILRESIYLAGVGYVF